MIMNKNERLSLALSFLVPRNEKEKRSNAHQVFDKIPQRVCVTVINAKSFGMVSSCEMCLLGVQSI